LEFERFRRGIRENHGRGDEALLSLPDHELARVLGAVAMEGGVPVVRMLGLLLFGKVDVIRRTLPTHEVAFQVLAGTKVGVNDFFHWPLLRTMEELEARFRSYNREEELMLGMMRIGVPDYPHAAFREGLANALLHRDYGKIGAVHVQWHSDHLEISSPGGFPEGVRLDNLLITPPRPRNPALADAFKRAGIVDRTARGIDTIFHEQVRNGRPAPSYGRSNASSVVLVLPGGAANLDFVRLVLEEGRADRELSLDGLLLLNEIWRERRLNPTDAAALVQKPVTEARACLNNLVEAGLLEVSGERRGRAWHLSAATYRRLDAKSAYVRQRGFDALQRQQMVQQYVKSHGRITRREVADLCQLDGDDAKLLLQRLVRGGTLVLRGQRKGAYYEAPKVMDDSETDQKPPKKRPKRPKARPRP